VSSERRNPAALTTSPNPDAITIDIGPLSQVIQPCSRVCGEICERGGPPARRLTGPSLVVYQCRNTPLGEAPRKELIPGASFCAVTMNEQDSGRFCGTPRKVERARQTDVPVAEHDVFDAGRAPTERHQQHEETGRSLPGECQQVTTRPVECPQGYPVRVQGHMGHRI
jgi:hypothetical protein